jgi:hypothetical protein
MRLILCFGWLPSIAGSWLPWEIWEGIIRWVCWGWVFECCVGDMGRTVGP